MTARGVPRVFNIPASANFLAELARAVLRGGFPAPDTPAPGPADLAQWTILVPTRRAARALEQIFLDQSEQRALLLPRIRPIGDIDEDILDTFTTAATADEAAVAPAISSLAREFVLVSLIEQWAERAPAEPLAREIAASPIQSLNLARSLAKLIDGFESRDLELGKVVAAYPEDFDVARHREAILDFLRIVTELYPQALHKLGFIGAIHRRSQLIRREADRLASHPPQHPVIAAGSTGSIAATAILLNVIARLETGAVVLPGLDRFVDGESWGSIADAGNPQGPSHAQYGMRMLLKSMGILPGDVELLPGMKILPHADARDWLIGEIMRPAATAGRWHEIIGKSRHRIADGLAGVERIEAANPREEASQIALRIRSALEDTDATVALVTPDRELALRVKAELQRWSIAADDSAGTSLSRTSEGSLFRLLLDVVAAPRSPVAWAALVHHPLAVFGAGPKKARGNATCFDLVFLRFEQWQGNVAQLVSEFGDMRARIVADRHAHPALHRIGEDEWTGLRSFATSLATIFGPLFEIMASPEPTTLDVAAGCLIHAFEQVASPGDPWKSEAGEALASALIAIRDEAHLFPPTSFARAALTIADLIGHGRVRAPLRGGSRLAILGLLEARLIRADVMILGGLNEGVWPAQPDPGPWLNRPMRLALGLEAPEREIGLVAHDFAQAFGAPRLVLSWSKRIGDAPATPSRWLLRLKMLADAADTREDIGGNWQAWSRSLDHVARCERVARPQPRPRARLAGISVSQVEKLYRDPYAIYAAKILDLHPLEGFASRPEASERGTLVHEALARFIARHAVVLPDDAEFELIAVGREVFGDRLADPDINGFWWPRFRRIAAWFVAEERKLRHHAEAIYAERNGKLMLMIDGEAFRVTGRADRVDILPNRRVRIIDYKTGKVPSLKQVEAGYAPQLTLEAAMIARGAFKDIPGHPASDLLYIRLSGGDPPGEMKPLDIDDVPAMAESHLRTLVSKLTNLARGIDSFLPRRQMEKEDQVSDYDHLSRRAEWEQS